MSHDEYTARMCPVCHCHGCSPECPEFDGPLEAEDDGDVELDNPNASYGHPRDCRCVLCEIGDYYGGAE